MAKKMGRGRSLDVVSPADQPRSRFGFDLTFMVTHFFPIRPSAFRAFAEVTTVEFMRQYGELAGLVVVRVHACQPMWGAVDGAAACCSNLVGSPGQQNAWLRIPLHADVLLLGRLQG